MASSKGLRATGYRDSLQRTREKKDAELVQQMLISARKMAAIGEKLKNAGGSTDMMISACGILKKECTIFFLAEDRLKMRGVDLYADSGRQLIEGVVGEDSGSNDLQSEEDED
jgi:hypothetical protein